MLFDMQEGNVPTSMTTSTKQREEEEYGVGGDTSNIFQL